MAQHTLAKLDLNLLVCLHTLLQQQSVSKAAEQLNLSQSAMSKSLARLREMFHDPLLERSGYGMTPTLKAKEIQGELHRVLLDIEKLTRTPQFSPALSDRTFHLATVESLYPTLLPHVVGDALQAAPNINLHSRNWSADTFEALQKGELDFALTGKDLHPADADRTLKVPADIHSSELFQDSLCCIMRASHPMLESTWDRDNYLSCRHIVAQYYKKERWLLDALLNDQGLQRNVAVYTPDFNTAAELCCRTDLILTVPHLYAKPISQRLNLALLPLPFPIPRLSYSLFWHSARECDPAHQWLRRLIQSSARSLFNSLPVKNPS